MNNKDIAKYEREFIGGNPKVFRYYNDDESKHIDILTSLDGYFKDTKVCATIGLNEVDIGIESNNKPITIELMAAATLDNEYLENIVAAVALDIIDSKCCKCGTVFKNEILEYYNNLEMKHVVLITPMFWEKYNDIEEENRHIVWLFLMPISDKELEYLNKNGLDSLEKLLEEKKVDILDYKRKSCI